MPELPDVMIYVERLAARVTGQRLVRVRVAHPFVLRTVDPSIAQAQGKTARAVRRLGKRIVVALDDDIFIAIHLMVAGRLHWRPACATIAKGNGLAAFDFPGGTLLFTEAGKKRRAALHVVRGAAALSALGRGGLEVLEATAAEFRAALARDNHTLKRALTDQSVLSGIGNAYSDEILHRARLSPFKRTHALGEEEWQRLYRATNETLTWWIERLRIEAGERFPEKVTAFRPQMSVHGRYGQPCATCGAPIQRIVYAENECNYCARCQTGGKLLADRALSRLLKDDWPRTLDELEGRDSRGATTAPG